MMCDEEAGIERLEEGRYSTCDVRATSLLGELLAKALQPSDTVVLNGDLGAGKTHFAGGVVRGLGDPRPVTSPTYGIMGVYDDGRLPLYHMDLYRIDTLDELEDTGVLDVVGDDGVCLVEWGARFADELGDERLDVDITVGDACENAGRARCFTFTGHGSRGESLAREFDALVAQFVESRGDVR